MKNILDDLILTAMRNHLHAYNNIDAEIITVDDGVDLLSG